MKLTGTTIFEDAAPVRGGSPVLRLRLLGHMAIDDSYGHVVLPRTRKTRAILAVLALATPRPVLRLTLTGLLWSQRQKEQARASLRQAVHELQDVLSPEWASLLQAERHHLTLRGDGLSVDALALGQATGSRLETLRQFQNVLLEDLTGLDPAFDRWLDEERSRLNRLARTHGESILAEQRGLPGAQSAAEHLLLIDRGHEGAWRALIRAHAEAKDRASALMAYERCRAALAELGRGVPSQETEDLLARLNASEPRLEVPDAAPVPPPATLAPIVRTGIRLGVLPLRLVDPAHPGHADGLALGLAEEITTSLARFRWISSVSGSSLTAIAGDIRPGGPLWQEMNLDFALDGSIQRGSGRVRILVRIVDMRSGGEVIWARRFDRDPTDTLALQDDLAAEIVAQVEPELLMREGERNDLQRIQPPTPHDLVLRAIPAIYRLEREGFQAAGSLLADALRADPNLASAHAWFSYWHLFHLGQGWAEDPAAASLRATELAERAVVLDPNDARALTLAGHVRGFLGRPREACALHDRAIALNPNLALAWCFFGLALSYLGEHEDALIRLRQASRMSPSDPHSFFFEMARVMPLLLSGEYEKAAEFGRRAIELNPWFSSSYKLQLAALGHLGREQEAASVRARLLTLERGFCVRDAIERSPITRPADLVLYAEGLRRGGLPEESRVASTDTVDLGSLSQHNPPDRGMARA